MIDIFCCYVVHKHCGDDGYLTSSCLVDLYCDWVQLHGVSLGDLSKLLHIWYDELYKKGEFDD